jgi:putative ABC transport system permease protein
VTRTEGRPSLAERLYALLLRVYPKRFRARFEEEMRESVRVDLEQSRTKGVGARTAFLTQTAAEAVYFGIAERRGSPAQPPHRASRWAFDWRDAYRSLRATPVVTAVAVISLALGIGANTALFSLLNSLMLKSLPVQAPEQLVVIDGGSWTNPIWEQIRDRHVFHQAFAWWATQMNLSDRGEADDVSGVFASGGLFDVLGVHAVLGRTFTAADDDRTGGPNGPVAVITDGFWQRRFGGARDVIGRRLEVNGLVYTIIGVTPKGFFGPDIGRAADIFVPIGDIALERGNTGMLDGRSNWWLEIMARLAPGESMVAATENLQRMQPAIRLAAMPDDWPAKMQADFLGPTEPLKLVPAANGESDLRRSYTQPLVIILVVVGAVLIIACANIANLLLARATARRRELSLRLALGASRARVARQLLAESAILSAAGAVLGLAFAQWGSALLVRQLSGRAAVVLDLSPDWRVLTFTGGVAVLTALLFGLAPALGVAHLEPNEALKEHGRGVIGDRRFGLRNTLVVGQVALSLVLVLGGALFLRTFTSLTTAALGFDPRPMMVLDVNASRVPSGAIQQRFADLLDTVRAVPGIAAAALAEITPMGGSGWNTLVDPPPGQPAVPNKKRLSWVNAVSPAWFTTYGMHVLAGRDVDPRDVAGAPAVAVVNEEFARRFLGGTPVVGAEVRTEQGPTTKTYTVVGVVNDSVYKSARAGFEPVIYFPLAQMSVPKSLTLAVRVAGGSPAGLAASVGRAVARAMPEAGFTEHLMTDQLGQAVKQERLVAMLAGFFGGLALLLAALGLYGVTSYSVNRQRGEIGIRMALGADRGGVLRMIIGRVVWLVAVGVVLGGALSVWASKFIARLLFNVTPRDPLTFAAATVVLFAAALIAGWLPARRAASIDPAEVLREG